MLDIEEVSRSKQMHSDEPARESAKSAAERSGRDNSPDDQGARRPHDPTTSLVIEEVLTYREAAQLLKVSARTLERWTREGLVPYLRLPQRGRWSVVRFSRNQLLRWLRQRTVKER